MQRCFFCYRAYLQMFNGVDASVGFTGDMAFGEYRFS